ncbi:MAG: hydantoinase B/oxoprolinase family protein, partial [Proteobacteria bacterium]|nr:hydantoinase B/oxoprolinase family protein [Pseudomonadota bacterium]
TVAYFAEMHEDPPKGTQGGLPGSASAVYKLGRDGREEPLPPIGLVDLQPGEYIRGFEAGGGGYGNPLQRDPLRVHHDVLEGWVSPEQACNVYGVALSGSREDGTLAVDAAATAAQRARLAAR